MSDSAKILALIKSHFPEFDTPKYNIKFEVENKIIKVEKRELGKLLPKSLFSNFINKKYFNHPTTQNLFHYLPAKYVKTILSEEKIRLYNLAKYVKNKDDSKEFSYFIDRIGLIIPKAEKYISSVIEDVFILSCTTEENSIDHWNYYGKDIGKACIHFSIDIKKSDYDVDVRNVVYESELTKLFCLQQCIKEQFGYLLDISKSYLFTKYVKRSYYEWEKEVRICFDNNSHQIGKKFESYLTNEKNIKSSNDKYFQIKEDELKNKYIEVPLTNDFFELSIASIQSDEKEIKELCEKNKISFVKKQL